MLRHLACALITAASLAACQNDPAPRRAQPASPGDAAPSPPANAAPEPPPPPPPPFVRLSLVATMPVVELAPQNRWRITVDVTVRNDTATAATLSRGDFLAAYAGADGGVGNGVAPSASSVLTEGAVAPGAGREARLVFELPAAPTGNAVMVLRWTPAGHEATELRQPVMHMPGIRPMPFAAPAPVGDAAVAPPATPPPPAPPPAPAPAPRRAR